MPRPSHAPEFTEMPETDGSGFLNSLLIVVVLYGKTPDQSTAYASLRTSLSDLRFQPHILIFDNSPRQSFFAKGGVTYFHDGSNHGISGAYNMAARFAEKAHKTWILFLDQDTVVTDALLPAFEKAVKQHPQSGAFVPQILDVRGPLSPFKFSYGRGWRTKIMGGRLSLSRFRFINSGLMIRLGTFVRAGGYDESIPLDFSDIYFGDRLTKVVDHFVLIDVALRHGFSDNENIPVEAALRRFTSFRISAAVMGQRTGRSLIYRCNVFLRAWILCIRYKDLRFLIRLFQKTHG